MLLWIEGFEEFAAAAGDAPVGLTGKYTVANGTGTTLQTGRTQGLGLRIFNSSANPTVQTPSMGNLTTWISGFGFRPGTTPPGGRICEILDGATVQFALYANASGQIEFRRGTTLIATSVSAPLAPATYTYLEFKVTIGNAGAGSYEIRANGTDILSDADEDTQATANSFAQTMKIWGIAGGSNVNAPTFDDWYIADTTAGEVDDFIGSHRCITIFPNAEGDTNDLTPSTGTDNSAMVDDVPHDSDSTYVESSTDNALDLYQFTNPELVQIKGVQINAVVRETDATPFSVELVSKTGATTDLGTSIAIGTTSYVNRHRVLETDPDTAVAWTDSGIDGAQFGIQIDA